MMKDRQFVTPLLVRNQEAQRLTRVPLSERTFSESELQKLLFQHPALIPVGEIEPVFEGLLPLAQEVPTGTGPLDLLFMNSKGFLTLAETKLWRNPEARRTVVAQIIDYAKHMSSWTYEDLRKAVLICKDRAEGEDPLIELAREEDEDFDEREFIDRVNRNLRLGRFVLLIIGDGIHEGVEQMADFLNQTPQLQFRLGLIEMGLYRLGDGRASDEYFVQPRVLARTREVVRAVVEIKFDGAPPFVDVTVPDQGISTGPRTTITEKEFRERLTKCCGAETPDALDRAFESAQKANLTVDWGDAGPLFKYVDPNSGDEFTFGQFRHDGRFSGTHWLYRRLAMLGLPLTIGEDYLEKTRKLIPNSRVLTVDTKHGRNGKLLSMGTRVKKDLPPLLPLLKNVDRWFKVIEETVVDIDKAMGDREP